MTATTCGSCFAGQSTTSNNALTRQHGQARAISVRAWVALKKEIAQGEKLSHQFIALPLEPAIRHTIKKVTRFYSSEEDVNKLIKEVRKEMWEEKHAAQCR